MSLLKIPFIAVLAYYQVFSVVPPNPPAESKEAHTPTLAEWWLGKRFASMVTQALVSGIAFAESAVIVAHNAPNLSLSPTILSTLVPDGDPNQIRITPSFLLGCLLVILGTSIRFQCYHSLGKLFTFQLAIRQNHKLITSGPYSYVRHPSYTGIFLGFVGILFWCASEGSWVRESGLIGKVMATTLCMQGTAVCTGLFTRMSMEDEMLKKEFGQEWEEWATKVHYALIPGVY